MARQTTAMAAMVPVLASLWLAGCPSEPEPEPKVTAPEPEEPIVASTKNHLLWKRHRAFERGLTRGLYLSEDGWCRELGRLDCADQVHLTALGGNDPFEQGLHEPLATPSGTTPVAVERVTLAACKAAVETDAARQARLLFFDVDLSEEAAPLDVEDEDGRAIVENLARVLYRRLHAREATAGELAEVVALAGGVDGEEPLRPRELALLGCFAVASSAESVFY